jgi:hypothetical protein
MGARTWFYLFRIKLFLILLQNTLSFDSLTIEKYFTNVSRMEQLYLGIIPRLVIISYTTVQLIQFRPILKITLQNQLRSQMSD